MHPSPVGFELFLGGHCSGCYTPLMSNIQVKFLGAGDAFCAGGLHQSGYLVDAGEQAVLLDCGATTLASLKRQGIPAGRIDSIILSHLHADHFSGIPFLFLEYMFEEERTRPLRIAGPPGTPERVADLWTAMYRDLASKPMPFKLEFVELLPDRPSEVNGIAVEPFRVPHQEKEISLGFGVSVGGRRILYSGDTGWTEALIRHSEDVDLLICECCFFETRMPFHLDYPCLWEHRERFGASRMILTHLGREVLARKREIELELAADGLTVEL